MFGRLSASASQALKTAGAVGLGIGFVGITASASDDHTPAQNNPWDHGTLFGSYDHASIRRGLQVYREVCAQCHSLNLVAFRTLDGVVYTEAEVKEFAKEYEVQDGPGDDGEMFDRPGKPSDYFPKIYPNDEAAKMMNNGAIPPDLSLITKARHNGQNYLFALLTGYCERAAGLPPMKEGAYYNPYFPGGQIGMPPPLMDEAVEFPDGTPATVSQMAKDVVTFLSWAAEPEMEERKLMGIRVVGGLILTIGLLGFYKRLKWAPIKHMQMTYRKGYRHN